MGLKATDRGTWKKFVAALIAAGACSIGATAQAAKVPWPADARFQYVAKDKSLRELLQHFLGSLGIATSIDKDVKGQVTGQFNMSPQAMLELLAARHHFLWYYDGAQLYITPASSLRTEVIKMPANSADQLQTTLASLGMLDQRYPLQVKKGGSQVSVSGPDRYVKLVQHVAESIRQSAPDAAGVMLRLDIAPAQQPAESPMSIQEKPASTMHASQAAPAMAAPVAVAPTASATPVATPSQAATPVPEPIPVTQTAKLSPAPTMLPPVAEAARTWDISITDNTLKSALTRWSKAAGWQLLWELPVDYQIEANTSIPGTFEDAVTAVATSMETSKPQMKVIFYTGNKVLRIVQKGGE